MEETPLSQGCRKIQQCQHGSTIEITIQNKVVGRMGNTTP